jgi:hypothetical protein
LKIAASQSRPARRVYGIPVLLAVLTMFGLLAALLGQGPWHGLSWLALSIPIVLATWYATRRSRVGEGRFKTRGRQKENGAAASGANAFDQEC